MRAFALTLTFVFLAAAVVAEVQQPGAPDQRGASRSTSQLKAQAEAGDPEAQFQLGRAYEKGDGVSQDDRLAAVWYRKSAEQGNAAAENGLGVLYWGGRGVEKDKKEAVSWYHKAAKLGSPLGMFNLGVCYYNGEGVGEDQVTAYAWFLLSLEAGDSAAQDAVRRSQTELNTSSSDQAFLRIGEMYEKGVELPQSNAEAARWYRKGADRNPEAAMRLAALLIDGNGVARDYGQAMEICRNAAKQRFGPAEYCVGALYQRGWGVDADKKEAARWYEQAAASGVAKAALALGEMYMKGDGVPVDRAEAYYFYFLASRREPDETQSRARALHLEMNKEEIKRLEKKLRQRNLDPKKVYAAVEGDAPTDSQKSRQASPAPLPH